MKEINNYLNEGFKINKSTKHTPAKEDLCPEVQNEFANDYAYQTFHIEKIEKFKYGFLTYDKDNEFYSVTALNEDSEFVEEFCNSYDIDGEELFDLKVGEVLGDDSHGPNYIYRIIRIW